MISKQAADYRPAETGKNCGNCSMFRQGRCTLVTGDISSADVCNFWNPIEGETPE